MNENILLHWIERGIFARGIFAYETSKSYILHWCNVKEFDKHIKMGGTMRSVGGTQNM
jgi:hypothetical protein